MRGLQYVFLACMVMVGCQYRGVTHSQSELERGEKENLIAYKVNENGQLDDVGEEESDSNGATKTKWQEKDGDLPSKSIYEEEVNRDTSKTSGIILFDDDTPSRQPRKIRFPSGKIIDIREVNPFRQLDYPILRIEDTGLEYLIELSHLTKGEQKKQLSGARLNEEARMWDLGVMEEFLEKRGALENDEMIHSKNEYHFDKMYRLANDLNIHYEYDGEYIVDGQYPEESTKQSNYSHKGYYLRAWVDRPRVEIAGDIAVVAYQITYYSNTEDILATQGYALIYDKVGNEIQRIYDTEDGFYDIRLSSDGRYLMQKYGHDYGEDGSGWLEQGFNFYNTETGELVFDLELGKDRFLDGFDYYFETYFPTFYRTEGATIETYLIDITNKNIYLKSMDRKKYSNDYPGYRDSLMPIFRKTRKISDLIKDGFTKISLK